jgi:hypothetical protein
MIGDLQAAHTAIYTALKAVSAITEEIGGATNPRIFSEIAEQGKAFPLILIQTLPSRDDSKTATGMERIFANANLRIVGINKSRLFNAVLKTEIDAAIDRQSFLIGDNRIMSISRDKEYRRMLVDTAGVTYAWAGGDYSVTIR